MTNEIADSLDGEYRSQTAPDRVTVTADLLEGGECGKVVLIAEGETKLDLEDAQQRFRGWLDRAKATEGLGALVAVMLEPMFVASELTDDRRNFVLGLTDALSALADLNKPAQIEDPQGRIRGWFGAAERDLSGLRFKGVSDEDSRIREIIDAAGQTNAWEVVAQYHFRLPGRRRQ